MWVCQYCYDELLSRGEELIVLSEVELEEPMRCEWCDEDDEYMLEIEFK